MNKGFTLIELLVVIVILGILAAIALPSFLSQVRKAKESEVVQRLGLINRAQQVYFLENGAFAENFEKLAIAHPNTANYTLSITANSSGVASLAIPVSEELRIHAGGVQVVKVNEGEVAGMTVLCRAIQSSGNGESAIVFGVTPSCGTNFELLD